MSVCGPNFLIQKLSLWINLLTKQLTREVSFCIQKPIYNVTFFLDLEAGVTEQLFGQDTDIMADRIFKLWCKIIRNIFFKYRDTLTINMPMKTLLAFMIKNKKKNFLTHLKKYPVTHQTTSKQPPDTLYTPARPLLVSILLLSAIRFINTGLGLTCIIRASVD